MIDVRQGPVAIRCRHGWVGVANGNESLQETVTRIRKEMEELLKTKGEAMKKTKWERLDDIEDMEIRGRTDFYPAVSRLVPCDMHPLQTNLMVALNLLRTLPPEVQKRIVRGK